MAIILQCKCGRRFRGDERLIGKRVHCPHCDRTYRVPLNRYLHRRANRCGEDNNHMQGSLFHASETAIADLPVVLDAVPSFAESAEPRAAELTPGFLLLDRYEICRKLGGGGMGTVYAAFDRVRQEEIAVKMLRQLRQLIKAS